MRHPKNKLERKQLEEKKTVQKARRVYRRLAKEAAAAKESEDAVRAALNGDSRKDFNG